MFILVGMTAIVTILGVYQIVGRYFMFLHLPISWTEETMRHLYVAIIMLGISAVEKTNSFATITVLHHFLEPRSPKSAQALQIFQLIMQVIFYGLLAYWGALLVWRTGMQKTSTATTGIPFAIVYMSLPIGGLMGFVHAVLKLLHEFQSDGKGGKSE
jgi:TRAP-type C4-dicarboxylate transport system permease small subunit